jgi:ATP-binding cassette, subfamily D (ALD), member 4
VFDVCHVNSTSLSFRTINDDQDTVSIDYISETNTRPLLTNRQSIDNPDQRIAQDADSLCRSLSLILPLVLISPFTIAYYIYRTWQITGYYGPLAIIIFFLVWTGINKCFISTVSRTIFRQNAAEGNFRFLHAQIRVHNEPIAFYHGDQFEHRRFDNYMINTLVPLLYRRTCQEFLLNISMNLFDYIGSILSYLLLALAIFVFHMYDDLSPSDLVAVISQTSFITMYLIYRFSQLNDLADKLTIIAANTHRVQAFVEYMKTMNTSKSQEQLTPVLQQNSILSIRNLSYSTPTNSKHVLMKDLNLTLYQGQRLLITGLRYFRVRLNINDVYVRI